MRLDDYDPNDIDVGQARGGGFGGGGGGGGLLLGLLPLIGSRFGCLGIAAVLLLFAVFGGLGNLGGIFGGGSGPTTTTSSSGPSEVTQECDRDGNRKGACNAFASAQQTWTKLFADAGQQFQRPKMRFFNGNGQSGCGAAQSAMGPFYCPSDQGIYLDTSFFDELARRFGAQGDFAQYYVIAHEFGHHIQHLTGAAEQVRQVQMRGGRTEGNAASVRLELQADCYAGVWAAKNKDRLEPGDLEEGMTAASAIGDDKLSGGASPDNFTHGTSAQRMAWLKRGLETGDPAACNTFQSNI